MSVSIFSLHYAPFLFLSPMSYSHAHECGDVTAVLCDTVDSDSSRAVVPEMFHVAPHGFVLLCLALCGVGCALLYVPIHGRTQTVIVGVQWGVRVDVFPSITLLSFFYRPCRTRMRTSAGTSLRCCVTRWTVTHLLKDCKHEALEKKRRDLGDKKIPVTLVTA